jgi:hypothetical protein
MLCCAGKGLKKCQKVVALVMESKGEPAGSTYRGRDLCLRSCQLKLSKDISGALLLCPRAPRHLHPVNDLEGLHGSVKQGNSQKVLDIPT